MFVQRVVLPDSRRESWTVLRMTAVRLREWTATSRYLSDIERSPNTVKAYAHDLKDWFVFLGDRAPDWRDVRLEDVGGFVAWLRLPPMIRSGGIAVLPSVEHHCGEATVNRKLSAVSAFYQHAARNGVELGELLTSWQPAGRARNGLAAVPSPHLQGPAAARRQIRLKASRKQPRILTPAEVQAILDSCERLRDRCCSRCSTTPACASARPSVCAMRTGRRRSEK